MKKHRFSWDIECLGCVYGIKPCEHSCIRFVTHPAAPASAVNGSLLFNEQGNLNLPEGYLEHKVQDAN